MRYRRHRNARCGPYARSMHASYLLAGHVAPAIVEDELRFALRKVEKHLRKVAVGPGKPLPRVRGRVVDVDGLVNETKSIRVLSMKINPDLNKTDSPPPAPYARKSDRACDFCRRRKTRCDGALTLGSKCTNCRRNQCPCTYQ